MESQNQHIRVECYAGHRGEERPHRFYLGKRKIEVRQVVDRWIAPDHRYFKVSGDDGGTYVLRCDGLSDRWELTLSDNRSAAEG